MSISIYVYIYIYISISISISLYKPIYLYLSLYLYMSKGYVVTFASRSANWTNTSRLDIGVGKGMDRYIEQLQTAT